MSKFILDKMRDLMWRYYSIRTGKTYCDWVKRYAKYFNIKARDDLNGGERKIEDYLSHLARDRNGGGYHPCTETET